MTLEDVLQDDGDLDVLDAEDEDEGEEEEAPPPAAEEPATAPEPKPEQPTTAPLHVVAELRAERNALREQNKQMLALLGQVQQRVASTPGAALADDLTPRQGEGDADYFGRLFNHLLTEAQETRKEREQRAEREAAARQQQEYVSKVVKDYETFRSTVAPDLVEAGNFLAKPISDQLEKIYPPESVSAIILGLERDMHKAAEQAGMGYGEYVWKTAIAAGYVPQAQRQKQEVAQQKRVKAESARGIGGAGASAGGMTQMEAMKAFHSGKAGRMQKIPELGGMTVEDAFASGEIRKLRK